MTEIEPKNREDISDGFHTFRELYAQRAVLWAVLLALCQEGSWKSWKHEDGTMYDGMFIAGLETPEGQYTFHIDAEWWDTYKIKELPNAPRWDGHKPEDITRLFALLAEGE